MKYIILFCALSVIIFVPIETYACTLSPIASLSATPNPVCVGCEVTLDGSGSSDPDGGSPSLESTHYIKKFEWDFDYDGVPANFNADYTENAPCDGKTTHTYQTAGTYTAGLRVTDNDAAEGGPSDLSSIATCMVYVVKVNKIVENGTTNEGPLYKCLNGTVNLEAKPYPEGCSFPSNEPQWLIIEKPSGSVPSLNPSSGSSTTLSNLSKPGKYVVKARCGNNDQGDTIDIYTFGGPILYYDCAQQDYGKYLILANPANQSREEDYYADSIQPQGTSYKWEI